MKKIFKTKIEDFEIIDIIIETLEDNALKQLINENAFLKHMCKKEDSKRFRFIRSIVEEKTKQLYKKDSTLRKRILSLWEIECMDENKFVDSIVSPDEIIDQGPEAGGLITGFKYCTVLWQKNNKEFNDFGDIMFKAYKLEKSKKNKESIEGIDVNSDIMSLSLGECIQALMKSEKQIEEMKNNIDEKNKEIKELKNELSSVIDNRELKKEIKALTRSMNEMKGDFKDKNFKLITEIDEIKKENITLKKTINEICGALSNFNSSLIVKEIIENQNNINNSLKGTLVESTQRNIEMLLKEFEKKIDDKIKINMTNSNKSIDINPRGEVNNERSEEKINFEELLENYF